MVSRLPRRTLDGADDAHIRAAAADMAVHRIDDLLPAGLGRLLEEGRRLHDLARLAVAALRDLLGDPRLLQRMVGIGRQALDRRHLAAGDVLQLRLARARGLAVDMNRARTALGDAAAELG